MWWMTATAPEKHRPFPVGAFTDKNLAEQAKGEILVAQPTWSIGEPFEAPADYPLNLPRALMRVTRLDGEYVIWSDGVEFKVE